MFLIPALAALLAKKSYLRSKKQKDGKKGTFAQN